MILSKIDWSCQGHTSTEFYVVILTDPGWRSQKAGIFWRHQRLSFRTSPVCGQLCKSWRGDEADWPWLFTFLLHQPGIKSLFEKGFLSYKNPFLVTWRVKQPIKTLALTLALYIHIIGQTVTVLLLQHQCRFSNR